MDRNVALAGAGVLALVGVAAGAWSLAKNTGGASSREFGRVGMSESRAPGPPGEGGGPAPPAGGEVDLDNLPEGANVMRMSPDDLPEGMRAMIMGDGMDPSSFDFPDIASEDDAYAMLDELRQALAAKASGATAYRQAPPIAKQRFAESAVAFFEPFIVESARAETDDAPRATNAGFTSERGIEGAYFGEATALAALDVARLRVSDAPELPTFTLPPEVLEGLDADAAGEEGEGVERRVQMSFMSSGGGWSRHQVNHPMETSEAERAQGAPLAQLALPMRADRLGDDVLEARLSVTMWWDEPAQTWRAGDVTLSYKTEDSDDEAPGRRRMEFRQ